MGTPLRSAVLKQALPFDKIDPHHLNPEQEGLEALLAENQRLRDKEGFLNKLLMAVTLLTRKQSLVSGNLNAALCDITRMAALSVEVQRVSVWFLDESRTTLTCACLFDGAEGLFGEGASLKAADYPAYFSEIERGRVVAADDALEDPRTCEFSVGYLRPLGITSMLDVPIKNGDRLAGVVCLEHTGAKRRWYSEEKQFAAYASSLVSLAVEINERMAARGDIRI
jgi:GAF domain-containing protein